MNTSNSGAASAAPQPSESRWHRFLTHSHVHFGANTSSIIMGGALILWIWKIYWLTTGAPDPLTVAWVITLYMIFEPITAALTVIRKDRWRGTMIDILIGVALIIQTVIVLYDHDNLALSGARAHLAWLFLVAMAGTFVTSILITLIVNTRVIGGVSVERG